MIIKLPYDYLRIFLLILSLLIINIQPVLYIFGIPLYSFPLILFTAVLTLESRSFRQLVLRAIIISILSIAICSIFFVFSIGFPEQYMDFIKASAQLIIGVSVACLVNYLIFYRSSLDKVYSFSRIFLLILFCLIFLERFLPPFKTSLQFIQRFVSFGTYSVYSAASRDLGFVGFVRPTLMAAEPSLLGILIYVFLIVQIFSSQRVNTFRTTLLFFIQVITFYSLVGSPIILFSLVVYYLNLFAPTLKSFLTSVIRFNKPSLLIVLLVSCTIIPFALQSASLDRIRGIFESSFQVNNIDPYLLKHSSYYVRYIAPVISLKETLAINPYFGFGIGGEGVLPEILGLPDTEAGILINNNLYFSIAAFGMAGILTILVLLFKYFKIHNLLTFSGCSALLLLSTSMGAPFSPRFIVYFSVVFCVIASRKQNDKTAVVSLIPESLQV